MVRLEEDSRSSLKMAKKASSGTKKSSSSGSAKKSKGGGTSSGGPICINMNDPKTQTVVLIGLLAILAVALWYGFTHGCLSRRRRRSSCS